MFKRIFFCVFFVYCFGYSVATAATPNLLLSIRSSATDLPVAGSFEITTKGGETVVVAGAYAPVVVDVSKVSAAETIEIKAGAAQYASKVREVELDGLENLCEIRFSLVPLFSPGYWRLTEPGFANLDVDHFGTISAVFSHQYVYWFNRAQGTIVLGKIDESGKIDEVEFIDLPLRGELVSMDATIGPDNTPHFGVTIKDSGLYWIRKNIPTGLWEATRMVRGEFRDVKIFSGPAGLGEVSPIFGYNRDGARQGCGFTWVGRDIPLIKKVEHEGGEMFDFVARYGGIYFVSQPFSFMPESGLEGWGYFGGDPIKLDDFKLNGPPVKGLTRLELNRADGSVWLISNGSPSNPELKVYRKGMFGGWRDIGGEVGSPRVSLNAKLSLSMGRMGEAAIAIENHGQITVHGLFQADPSLDVFSWGYIGEQEFRRGGLDRRSLVRAGGKYNLFLSDEVYQGRGSLFELQNRGNVNADYALSLRDGIEASRVLSGGAIKYPAGYDYRDFSVTRGPIGLPDLIYILRIIRNNP